MDQILRMLLVAFGIGLVIFVHEAGHYLAARLIGVRVQVFSLGFGPKLLGFVRGGTLYQLAAIPMGGYVAVAGEDPSVRAPLPDELPSKSVGQRFLYYSGGVLMNLAFAVVVLPLIFMVGVPFERPILGEPIPGGPAWHAGLEAGTTVLAVNGSAVYDFNHIPTAVALGPTEGSTLRLRLPDGREESITVRPEKSDQMGLYTIAVRPALDPQGRIQVAPDSPAAAAGLNTGDRLEGIEGAPAGLSLAQQFAAATTEREPIELRVRGPQPADPVRRVRVEPDLAVLSKPRLGIAPPVNHVVELRHGTAVRDLGLEVGDRILHIDGQRVWRAGDVVRHALVAFGDATFHAFRVGVERAGSERELVWPELDRAGLLARLADVAIDQSQAGGTIAVYAGEAGSVGGLRSGDRVVRIDGVPVAVWKDIEGAVSAASGSLRFEVQREGESGSIGLDVTPAAAAVPNFGFALMLDQYVYRSASFGDAVRVGLVSSWRMLADVWLSLKKLVLREVPSDSLGGVITISVVSYTWAEAGVAKLLFFLCLLSINLAFLNVLPIPVLDGGQLFFLGVEAIKGSPVSEKVFGYSQMVGLVLIVTLMVYVTYSDLMRWVF